MERNLKATCSGLRQTLGRDPLDNEIADAMGLSKAAYTRACRTVERAENSGFVAFEEAFGDDQRALARAIGYVEDGPDVELERTELRMQLVAAMGKLHERERKVLLPPGEMTAVDVSRYQLYSRQGALGSLASLHMERAQLRQTAQRATAAAQGLLELQREWAELEGAAERLLARGEAFRHLTFEIERNAERDRALDARDGRAEGRQGAPTFQAAALGPYDLAHYQGSTGYRIGAQHGRVRHAAARRRNPSRHGRPGWARVSALVLTGGVLAVIVAIVAQRYWPHESAVAATAPPAIVEAQPQDGDQERPPESDVARERAALDALPNQ
jgi:hypothetical protein